MRLELSVLFKSKKENKKTRQSSFYFFSFGLVSARQGEESEERDEKSELA